MRLDVQVNAPSAREYRRSSHLGFLDRITAVEHAPDVEGHAGVFEVLCHDLELCRAADRVLGRVVLGHPRDAVVCLEDHPEAVVAKLGAEDVRFAVGRELPHPHEVVVDRRVHRTGAAAKKEGARAKRSRSTHHLPSTESLGGCVLLHNEGHNT